MNVLYVIVQYLENIKVELWLVGSIQEETLVQLEYISTLMLKTETKTNFYSLMSILSIGLYINQEIKLIILAP